MRGPAAAAAPPAPSFSSVGPSARGPADSPLLPRAEVTSGFSGFSACAVPPEVLKCPLKRQPRRSSSGHSVSGSAQKGLAFRAEVASCRRGLVTWFHTLVALSFQRSVSENSLVAMDFSGQTGRVIENPAEAQSAALEEGHAWRKRSTRMTALGSQSPLHPSNLSSGKRSAWGVWRGRPLRRPGAQRAPGAGGQGRAAARVSRRAGTQHRPLPPPQ